MLPLLAQTTTSSTPVLFSLVAGAVGASGIVAALFARHSVKKERDTLLKADTKLASEESWQGAHAPTHHDLSHWLTSEGIGVESGVADVIRTYWSAWLGVRSPSLAEIHAIVPRRERVKIPVRFSAGVAALLLVIGIVGTLSSVKPVLADFQFRTSVPEGVVPATDAPLLVNVEDSTALVNSLMHNLGNAFLPSLVALVLTVVVVAARGLYSLELQRYSLELDRFALGTAMPHYRPRSLTEEYSEVRSVFETLAKDIKERERGVEESVIQLHELLEAMKPAVSGMQIGITKMAKAADNLANKSVSAAENLINALGETSPAYIVLERFEKLSESTNTRLEKLAQLLSEMTTEQEKERQKVIETVDDIKKATGQIRSDFDGKMDQMNMSFGQVTGEMVIKSNNLHSQISKIHKELTNTAENIAQGHKEITHKIHQIQKELSGTTVKIQEETRLMNAAVLNATKETMQNVTTSLTETLSRLSFSGIWSRIFGDRKS